MYTKMKWCTTSDIGSRRGRLERKCFWGWNIKHGAGGVGVYVLPLFLRIGSLLCWTFWYIDRRYDCFKGLHRFRLKLHFQEWCRELGHLIEWLRKVVNRIVSIGNVKCQMVDWGRRECLFHIEPLLTAMCKSMVSRYLSTGSLSRSQWQLCRPPDNDDEISCCEVTFNA